MAWNTRDFLAFDIPSITGQGPHSLSVTGEVEVRATNETPHLVEVQPQGINQYDLVLALTVTSAGQGADVLTGKRVSFSKEIGNHKYLTVTVRESTTPLTIKVEQAQS